MGRRPYVISKFALNLQIRLPQQSNRCAVAFRQSGCICIELNWLLLLSSSTNFRHQGIAKLDFVVKLVERETSSRREREFRVAIKFAAKADLHHLQQFLRCRQLDVPQETIQVLDVVLRSTPSNKQHVYAKIGSRGLPGEMRNICSNFFYLCCFFSPQLGDTCHLGDGIEYWKGYYQSLRPTQMGLSLNIDVSATAFYEPVLVSDFVATYYNVRDLSSPLSDQDRIKIEVANDDGAVRAGYFLLRRKKLREWNGQEIVARNH
ncbi:Protein argonaute MEL1 [Camellia lanceoleosa]|uniref:Protein argonaute MEL1 n=1 Tax=Camellia lanceoleosa TaxID=1840588 RepID=A0ACC0FBQ9_9ERIC|nr:Protein argonaute MEL1 [Camellia lanceoleosa]